MTGYEDWSVAGWRTHLPGVADVPAFAAGLGGETIPALAATAADRVPDRVAVTVDGEPVTHAELDDEAGQVAAWLARRVRPGDRVLLAAGASLGFVRCTAFTPDGWFRTGDIGAVDPATGHLAIRGRAKEMIITGGLNVYPREVEIALEGHPSVAEAAVAGAADERWGERVTAWVVLRDGHGFDEAALIAHARTQVAGYKCPKRIFQLAELPRNQLGKVVRGGLRERG